MAPDSPGALWTRASSSCSFCLESFSCFLLALSVVHLYLITQKSRLPIHAQTLREDTPKEAQGASWFNRTALISRLFEWGLGRTQSAGQMSCSEKWTPRETGQPGPRQGVLRTTGGVVRGPLPRQLIPAGSRVQLTYSPGLLHAVVIEATYTNQCKSDMARGVSWERTLSGREQDAPNKSFEA